MLGTRTFQRPDGPGASTSMAPRTAFHRWAMSGAWRRQKSLMVRLRSARQEGAELANVLLEGGCLPLQLLLQLALRGRAEPGRHTLAVPPVSRSRRLGPDAMPGRVRLVRCRGARC